MDTHTLHNTHSDTQTLTFRHTQTQPTTHTINLAHNQTTKTHKQPIKPVRKQTTTQTKARAHT